MAYVTQLAYSSESGVDQMNELLGQIKDLLVSNSALVTVISDNNPAAGSGTYRVVVLQVDNSDHYFRIETIKSTTIRFSIRNLANNDTMTVNSDLCSFEDTAPNNKTMHLVYGNNALAFRYSNAYICCYAKDVSGNMWCQFGNRYVFVPYDSDSYLAVSAGTPYMRITSTGEEVLLPARLIAAATSFPALYAYNAQDKNPIGTVYQDSNDNYYMSVYHGSSIALGGATVYPDILAKGA